MDQPILWHNPRCSKSRQALKLLQERGVEPEIRKYLEQPPSFEELSHVLDLLGFEPRDLMRKKEAPYKELSLKDPNKTREELIQAMVEHPILIERPVLIVGQKAVLGRPPERVLELVSARVR